MEFVMKQESARIIQGEFSLKNLGYFIKCTNLSHLVYQIGRTLYDFIHINNQKCYGGIFSTYLDIKCQGKAILKQNKTFRPELHHPWSYFNYRTRHTHKNISTLERSKELCFYIFFN